MAHYLLSVHMVDGEPAPSEEVMQQMFQDVGAFNESAEAAGVWVYANGLMPADIATVVDASGPEVLITDGPFSEAKEHIGGFWIFDLPDMDAALDWARRGSAAGRGPVEVRPFQPDPTAGDQG